MKHSLFVRVMVIVLIIAMIVPSFAFALAWMLG